MREIVWTRAAEADLQSIYEFLEDRDEGVGEGFLAHVNTALDLLKRFPEMAPVHHRRIRRLLLRGTHYGIFYAVEARGLLIHAAADLRRDPDDLNRRFRRVGGP